MDKRISSGQEEGGDIVTVKCSLNFILIPTFPNRINRFILKSSPFCYHIHILVAFLLKGYAVYSPYQQGDHLLNPYLLVGDTICG